MGGLVLGWIFSRDQEKTAPSDDDDQAPVKVRFYQKRGFWGTALILIALFVLSRLFAFSPLNFSTESHLSDYLPSDSIGVHWSDPWVVTETDSIVGQTGVAQTGNLVAITLLQ